MDFYNTTAQVIPTLLIVAALQSSLFDRLADMYRRGGGSRIVARILMFSMGGSLIAEALALTVLLFGNSTMASNLKPFVFAGSLVALSSAWVGAHLSWIKKRDNS